MPNITGDQITNSNEDNRSSEEVLFPVDKTLQNSLPDSFILNKPKTSGVGGDDYWVHRKGDILYIAIYDCMGHGHLASMMTRIYKTALEKVIVQAGIEFTGPILQFIHREIQSRFEGKEQKQISTGADFGIIRLDLSSREMEFAGAKIDLLQVYDKDLKVIKGDRMQVGEMFEFRHQYNSISIDIKEGTSIFYLTTDGAKDAIGGLTDRKLGGADLKKLLLAHSHKEMKDQQKVIHKFLETWQGKNEPHDDILMIGFTV